MRSPREEINVNGEEERNEFWNIPNSGDWGEEKICLGDYSRIVHEEQHHSLKQ